MMKIALADRECPFAPWRLTDGKVFADTYALDIETTRIDEESWWSVPDYVLAAVCNGQRGYFLMRERVPDFLRIHQNVPVCFHNAPFDLRVLHRLAPELDIYGWVDRRLVRDTRLLHRLLKLATRGHTASKKGQATLERCAELYLDVQLPKDVKDGSGNDVRLSWGRYLGRPAAEIDPLYLEYLGKDVMATWAILQELSTELLNAVQSASDVWGYVSQDWLKEQVDRFGVQTHDLQLASAVVLDDITVNGIGVDTVLAHQYTREVESLRAEKVAALNAAGYHPGQKGANSTLQSILGRLAEEHGLSLARTPGEKQFSTAEEDLGPYAARIPFIHDLLAYKTYNKLLSTYLGKMTASRLHPSFDVLKSTGRTSSFGDINAQNLPRDDKSRRVQSPPVKRCVVPADGYLFLVADYSAIESCTLAEACISQFGLDSVMARAINSGKDIHRMVAAHVLGKPEKDVTSEERQKAKPINFGLPGGMMPNSLQAYALTYQVILTFEEAVRWREGWLDLFPEMRAFLQNEEERTWQQAALETGLTPAEYNAAVGRTSFRQTDEDFQPTPWLGAMLLKVLREEAPATRECGRPYTTAELTYLWSRAKVLGKHLKPALRNHLERCRPSFLLYQAARNYFGRAAVFTSTGRLRALASYCARHNTVFQGLAADGAKLALWRLWRSPYLRRQGCRLVNFVHDEMVIEVPIAADLATIAAEVETILVAEMQRVVPNVKIKVKLAYRRRWGSDPADEVKLPGDQPVVTSGP